MSHKQYNKEDHKEDHKENSTGNSVSPNGWNSVGNVSTHSAFGSVDNNMSTPAALVSVNNSAVPSSPAKVSIAASPVPLGTPAAVKVDNEGLPCSDASPVPKVSMSRSVVQYKPPLSFDPFKLKAYEEGLLRNPPKVIQFKRSKYSVNQVERDAEAIAKASKRFPRSIIELCD